MKRLKVLFPVLLSLFIISLSYGQEENQTTGSMKGSSAAMSKMSREITELETAITQAVKDKDAGQFGSYLASDFQAVYDFGILNKDQEIQRVQKIDAKNYKRSDEKLTFPADNVAILTYKSIHGGVSDGQNPAGTYNVSSTFVKQNGKWVAVEHMMVKSVE